MASLCAWRKEEEIEMPYKIIFKRSRHVVPAYETRKFKTKAEVKKFIASRVNEKSLSFRKVK
jgi:hypothetical protein